jgi:hypothetical protein
MVSIELWLLVRLSDDSLDGMFVLNTSAVKRLMVHLLLYDCKQPNGTYNLPNMRVEHEDRIDSMVNAWF